MRQCINDIQYSVYLSMVKTDFDNFTKGEKWYKDTKLKILNAIQLKNWIYLNPRLVWKQFDEFSKTEIATNTQN